MNIAPFVARSTTIGKNANIAAGAIVVENVPEGMVAVGPKASLRGAARVSFSPTKGPLS